MSSIHEAIKKTYYHDGAMGTMLQRYNFSEEDFRGERFKDFPHSLKGTTIYYHSHNLKQSKEVHAAYFEAGLISLKPILQEPSEWPITT
jgi:5-methyltetrahydrofolate--homocysteine methyltransferase